MAGKAPAALSLKTSKGSSRFGCFDEFLTCIKPGSWRHVNLDCSCDFSVRVQGPTTLTLFGVIRSEKSGSSAVFFTVREFRTVQYKSVITTAVTHCCLICSIPWLSPSTAPLIFLAAPPAAPLRPGCLYCSSTENLWPSRPFLLHLYPVSAAGRAIGAVPPHFHPPESM